MKSLRNMIAVLGTLALTTIAGAAMAESVVVRAGRQLDLAPGRDLTDQAIPIEGGRNASISPWSAGSGGGARRGVGSA
jgi:hypothetical protein